eukprot:6010222-Ditylum_brightwellii.AAC.1
MHSPMLRAEWDGIVQKHCYTAGWFDKNEVDSKENRGQDWDTLGNANVYTSSLCARRTQLNVMP